MDSSHPGQRKLSSLGYVIFPSRYPEVRSQQEIVLDFNPSLAVDIRDHLNL